jgi:Flp pilus assembly protein TadD
MSKPMIVTLPFVLLLFDFWPLLRFQSILDKKKIPASKIIGYLIWEKIPLFILAAISCLITFFVQQHGGAVSSIEALPLNARVANAIVSYTSYIGKMIWPLNLAVLYPLREWHPGQVIMSGLLLLFLSVLAVRAWRRFPYLTTGWLWYLGTMVPVIGLVQVGSQSMADRYTYIPLIGLFIIIAWGMSDISAKLPGRRIPVAVFSSIILIVFMICAWFQVGHWRNGVTLFIHAINVTRNNSIAHYELGHALDQSQKYDRAVTHYFKALQINPKYVEAHNNLGYNLSLQGKIKDAVYHYNQALRIDPNHVKAHNNLGNVLARQGNFKDAVYHFNKAIKVAPNYAGAYYNLGKIFSNHGETKKAFIFYYKALELNPEMTQVLYNLSWIKATHENEKNRNGEKAVKLAEKLCKITKYNQPLALDALAAAYAETKRFDAAVLTAKKALELALHHGPEELAIGLKKRLQLYQAELPYRQNLLKKNE